MPINAAHGNFREPASDDWDIERRLTGPEYGPADGENEFSLRPRNFDEYVGQDAVKENLSVFIAAARGGWARRRCPASSRRNWA